MVASTQTSPMSAWLVGLSLGAIDALALLELGFIGLVFTLLCLALIAWKGPRLSAAAGLVTGVGLVWTVLFVNVMTRCAIENLTPGSGCDAGDIGVYVGVATGVLVVGGVGTVIAARRLRDRPR